mgnify:CR=1 FL=1
MCIFDVLLFDYFFLVYFDVSLGLFIYYLVLEVRKFFIESLLRVFLDLSS